MAKITLDLDALIADGKITAEEATRLEGLAEKSGALTKLIQVLYVFGALALAAGVVLLKPDPVTGMVLAAVALAFAAWAQRTGREDVGLLGTAMAICGTIGLTGSIGLQFGEVMSAFVLNTIITAITLASAFYFRSSFLAALVPLGVAAMLGSGTAYWHAAYAIFVREAAITALVFGALSIALFVFARRFAGVREAQAIVAARVSWLIMNFGFWVGSLWGDLVGEHFYASTGDGWSRDPERLAQLREWSVNIPAPVFVLAWAAVSIATIAVLRSNRFAVNASITFLAINAYTQFFEYLGENPLALLAGGISLLGFAWGLYRFDQWAQANEGKG